VITYLGQQAADCAAANGQIEWVKMHSEFVQIAPAEVRTRRPSWLKVRMPAGEDYYALKGLMRGLALHTVCESARCPNIGECWGHGTATFMILGDQCTRRCGFCAVPKGRPRGHVDAEEPDRVARAAQSMGLSHVVVTSVDRDDLPDGGSGIFARVIEALRRAVPGAKVEVLIPDFRGSAESLQTVLSARPDVLNHNIETVRRLYPVARRGSGYERSLDLLAHARSLEPSIATKSGLMVGLGETFEEVCGVLEDLARVGVQLVTIGQYLRPSGEQLPVARFYSPEEFVALKLAGEAKGIRHVESGPLVRSSYHASEQTAALHSRHPQKSAVAV
jgi:lipoyl synthase